MDTHAPIDPRDYAFYQVLRDAPLPQPPEPEPEPEPAGEQEEG